MGIPQTPAHAVKVSAALPSGLWRLGDLPRAKPTCIATGFDELSARLPGHGWPLGALTEMVSEVEGVGELRLIMPALAYLTARAKWVVWICPPFIPYAPALLHHGLDLSSVMLIECPTADEGLWAAEQVLRMQATGAVLLWPSRALDERKLRRLQLAAETGVSAGFLFRTAQPATRSSPAALRLKLSASHEGLQIQVLKCRGGNPGARILLTDV